MLRAWLALQGAPDPHPDVPQPDTKVYFVIFGLGFLIAVLGHFFQVRFMVAAGIIMVMCVTLLAPALYALGH